MYDDLLTSKGRGTLIDRLVPVSGQRLSSIVSKFNPPFDYMEFLSKIGAGEIGRAGMMLYDGLVEPEEIVGPNRDLGELLFFGDDFQGVSAAFQLPLWTVVEVDSSNWSATLVAACFDDYIRSRLREML